MRWNDQAIQHGARWRYLKKAPVRMQDFSKDRRFFIGISLDGGNVFMPINMAKKGIFAKRAKISGEALKVMIAEMLIGKNENFMFQPMGAEFLNTIG